MNVSPGRRFMIDLLVGSLMADGGLESALNAAITAEIQVRFSSFAVLYKQSKRMFQVFSEVCGLLLSSLDLRLEPVFYRSMNHILLFRRVFLFVA